MEKNVSLTTEMIDDGDYDPVLSAIDSFAGDIEDGEEGTLVLRIKITRPAVESEDEPEDEKETE